ncbi:unnamed protein product, partial [Ascophyllum nodosum]
SRILPVSTFIDNKFTLYFPTPDIKLSDDEIEMLIQHTHDLIDEGMSQNPDRVVLDMKGNHGGNFYVFYASLYPFLPYINPIIIGVNKQGEKVAEIRDDNDVLRIIIEGMCVYSKKITRTKKYDIKVHLEIDERSMSSSQLITLIFLQTLGQSYITGNSPALYTNGSSFVRGENEFYIPYYIFTDKHGQVLRKE